MSNVDAPDVNSGETNNPDLLAEQSGMPNMSSTKTFTVDTNMQVNGDLDVTGTVTATSFVGDGSQLTGISGGTGGGLDSAAVTLLVDSDYVQARQTPQDFAYSSLTGAPTALSSFTNDTNYITAADIPATVDSDYVQARVTLDGVGLDSAGVTALVDSDYVAVRAPAASGGLDSAEVISTINDEFKVSSSKVEIGQLANASGGFSVALGYGSTASGPASYAIGDATASGSNAIAFVDNAVASASLAIAIGQRAEATHINTIALGNEADAKGNYGIAIGDNAAATATDTLAIGKSASASTNNAIDIRTSAAGSLTYDTTNDWTFGAGVTMTDLTASGATVVFSNLPTTDPVNAGQLWNDGGTLKVSAG